MILSADPAVQSSLTAAESAAASSGSAGFKRERDDEARQDPTPQRVKVEAELPAAEASPPPPPPTGWRQAFIEKCVKTHYEQIAFVGKVRATCKPWRVSP